jgi:hypothetical protein
MAPEFLFLPLLNRVVIVETGKKKLCLLSRAFCFSKNIHHGV